MSKKREPVSKVTFDDPYIGRLLNGRYEIAEKVGKGSFGAVYLSYDHYLGNSPIAIKIFHPKILHHVNAPKRLAQEIQAANRIDHGNVVRFYDFFRTDDLCAIVMEYVDGPSLRKHIEECGRENYVFATDVLRQITLGLQAIHQHGIIHRDMKPDNILLADGWNAKITDFGIAYIIEGNTESPVEIVPAQSGENGKNIKRQLAGTIRYISPESVQYGRYDQRSDIYAIGVVLYEMLIGKYFFQYKDSTELLKMKVKYDPTSPALIRKDCPPMLEKICCKALERDPEKRYQSTGELLDDISILRSELTTGEAYINTRAAKANREVRSLMLKITFAISILTLVLVVIIIVILLRSKGLVF